MFELKFADRPLLLGLALGLCFGLLDLLLTWLEPLADDSIPALLRFYGPMFLAWAFIAFRAARRSGQLSTGVTAGLVVAFGTFSIFYLLNLLRVNLFLSQLTGRADWQNMMLRFQTSDFKSIRLFVNLVYLQGAPLKIGVASLIGALMGLGGGAVGRFSRSSTIA